MRVTETSFRKGEVRTLDPVLAWGKPRASNDLSTLIDHARAPLTAPAKCAAPGRRPCAAEHIFDRYTGGPSRPNRQTAAGPSGRPAHLVEKGSTHPERGCQLDRAMPGPQPSQGAPDVGLLGWSQVRR